MSELQTVTVASGSANPFWKGVHVSLANSSSLVALDLRDRIWRSEDRGRSWAFVCRMPLKTNFEPSVRFVSDGVSGHFLAFPSHRLAVYRIEKAGTCPEVTAVSPADSPSSFSARTGAPGIDLHYLVRGSAENSIALDSYRTFDGGVSFQKVFRREIGSTGGDVFVSPEDRNRIAVVATGSVNDPEWIHVSRDGGKSWKKREFPSPSLRRGWKGANFLRCHSFSGSNGDVEDAGSWSSGVGICPDTGLPEEKISVQESTDGNGAWKVVSEMPALSTMSLPAGHERSLRLVKTNEFNEVDLDVPLTCCDASQFADGFSSMSASKGTIAFAAGGELYLTSQGKSLERVAKPSSEPPIVRIVAVERGEGGLFALSPFGDVWKNDAMDGPQWTVLGRLPFIVPWGRYVNTGVLRAEGRLLLFGKALSLDGGRTWGRLAWKVHAVSPTDKSLWLTDRDDGKPGWVARKVTSWAPFTSVPLPLEVPEDVLDTRIERVTLGGSVDAPVVILSLSRIGYSGYGGDLQVHKPGTAPQQYTIGADRRLSRTPIAVFGSLQGKETLFMAGEEGALYRTDDFGISLIEILPSVRDSIGIQPSAEADGPDRTRTLYGRKIFDQGVVSFRREVGSQGEIIHAAYVGRFAKKTWDKKVLDTECNPVDAAWDGNAVVVACETTGLIRIPIN